MNTVAPLEEILSSVQRAYFRREWDFPSGVLEATLDRCWRSLTNCPDQNAAAQILIYRFRAGVEERANLDDACELVRLLELLVPGFASRPG